MAGNKHIFSNVKKDLSNNPMHFISGVLLGVIVVATIALAAGQYLYQEIRFNARVLSAKQEAQETLKHNVDLLDELNRNFDLLQSNGITTQNTLDALPVRQDYPALATIAEMMANVAGVELEMVTVSDLGMGEMAFDEDGELTEPVGPIVPEPEEIPIQLVVRGNYTGILAFLQNLQLSQRPIVIHGVDISGSGNQLNASIQAATYMQAESSIGVTKEVIHEE